MLGEKRKQHFRPLKMSVLSSTLLFVFSLVIGYVLQGTVPTSTASSTDMAVPLTFVGLVMNNSFILLMLFAGALTFGITSVFFLFTTGAFVGGITQIALSKGFTLFDVAILLLPHGIIELPAYILAASIGLHIAQRIVQYLRGKREKPMTFESLELYLELIVVAFLCIVFAAFVEAEITPWLASELIGMSV